LNRDAAAWALDGGEDYELLLTVAPDRVNDVCAAITAETGTRVSVVGEITEGADVRVAAGPDGPEQIMRGGGWDHFADVAAAAGAEPPRG
jgi:thiamine-monophosphate kinase